MKQLACKHCGKEITGSGHGGPEITLSLNSYLAIRADENTTMGIVTDVKQELRRCSALKIMYSARKAEK